MSSVTWPVSVKGVVELVDGIVLLHNERDEWELPGGRLEPGETPEECVRREIREETGLDVRVSELIDAWVHPVLPDRTVLVLTYACAAPTDGRLRVSDEHDDVAVVALDRIDGARCPMATSCRSADGARRRLTAPPDPRESRVLPAAEVGRGAVSGGDADAMSPTATRTASDRLLDARVVMLTDEVSDESSHRLIAELLMLATDDPESDICLFVNSPGGSVLAGLAVYDVMQLLPCDVVTVATGLAASMGQVLLCAGAPGKRFALPNAQVLMHEGSAGIGGSVSDVEIQASNLVATLDRMRSIIARHTGNDLAKVMEDVGRDRWFDAEESLEYGFVDHIVATLDDVLPRRDRDIHLYINSQGGSFTAALAIYDTMQFVAPDVATLCVGQAASASAILLAAGAPGKRAVLEHARVLLQQPQSDGRRGSMSDLALEAAELARMRAEADTLLARHTGRSNDQVRADTERALVLAGADAISYGVADVVPAASSGGQLRAGAALHPERQLTKRDQYD